MFMSPSSNNASTYHHRHHRHHHHRSGLSRPSSVSSLTGLVDLDIPEPDEGMAGPIVTLIDVLKSGNVRNASILHLVVLSLLLFVTLNDVVSRTISKSGVNRSNQFSPYQDRLTSSDEVPSIYHSSSLSTEGESTTNNNNRSNIQKNGKTKGLLGPAMIQSVTEALSPILPFAGGVDLRRDENWKSWNSWLSLWDDDKDLDSIHHSSIHTVSSIPRGGGIGSRGNQVSSKNLRSDSATIATTTKQLTFKTKPTLSTTVPFFPVKDIEQMTLYEIVALFDYVATPNIEISVFMKQKFPEHVNTDLLKRAIVALNDATSQSRGNGVIPAVTIHENGTRNANGPLSSSNGYGDIDALEFCAVMRVLAEWRVLRQVPPGYKQYSVGMNLGHKDIVQNIVKIESAIHKWIDERAELEAVRRASDENGNIEPRSPTLREILQYEVDMDVHPNVKLPRLKDKTAAMGLLWVRRQLQYQTAIFKNIIDVPTVYPTTINAVTAAYAEVYGNLHGWTVQKIFNYSFQSAPDADLIYRHMNPAKLEKVFNAAKRGLISPKLQSEEKKSGKFKDQSNRKDEQNIEQGEAIAESDCSDDKPTDVSEGKHPFCDFFCNIGNEWDKIGRHIQGEWDKIFNKDGKDDSRSTVTRLDKRGGANNSNKLSDEEIETYVSNQMAADAHEHILVYLEVVSPILNDISGLFDEMNMDDPTKV